MLENCLSMSTLLLDRYDPDGGDAKSPPTSKNEKLEALEDFSVEESSDCDKDSDEDSEDDSDKSDAINGEQLLDHPPQVQI